MRLTIIRRRYNPFGGAERFIEGITPRLAERGIITTIIAEDWRGARGVHGGGGTTSVIRVKSSGWTRTARFFSFQKAVQQALAASLQGDGDVLTSPVTKFDLIQSHERLVGADIFRLGDGVHTAWVRRLQREAKGLKSFWLRQDTFHQAVIETERAMAREPKLHYVANSALVRDELQEYLSVPGERITLIPNGVDTKRFVPPLPAQKEETRRLLATQMGIEIAQDAVVVSFVGSGFRRKGVFQLILACVALKNCVLLVCGKDKDANKAKAMIARLGAGDRIVLTGPLQDVRPLLCASDLFALPSLYDPSSNAVLEALSCGLPVVVTKDVGMAQEIAAAQAGTICTRDPESIMQGLRVGFDPAQRQMMSDQARSFALGYDQDRVIDQWLDFYNTLQATCA